MWEWDIQNNRITWTDRIYEFQGIEPGSFGGTVEDFARLVHPDDLPATQEALSQTLARQAPYELELRTIRPDGEIRWIFTRAEVFTDGAGVPERMIGISQDVTERKQTEEALRESEARLRFILDKSPDFTFLQDREGRFVWASKDFAGFTVGDYLGRTDVEMARLAGTPEIGQQLHALKLKLMEEGRSHQLEAPITLHGVPHHLLAVHEPWRDSEGRVIGLAGYVRDITERKAMEEALREADRRKDEFLAMLAHELRNPLAPIRNAAQVLKLTDPAGHHSQLALEIIERQSQHLARLVDDLLDVSRITRGKITLSLEPLDLATILHRAVETSHPLIDARRHQLIVELPPQPVRLDGDLTRLVQVVSNLLNNAAKYTDEGGSIQLGAAVEHGEAVIRVRDNGMGIHPDLLPHVFDLFTQAERSLDRSQGGLGIGLKLVRQLVELHGGRVEARSDGSGQGSEFAVWLPMAAPLRAD